MSRIHGSRHHRLLALAGVLGLLASVGCRGGGQGEVEGALGEAEAPLNLARRAEQLPVYQSGQQGGQQGQVPAIQSDAEIAGVLKAANLAEIEFAQMACVDAESQEVQSFAEMMITHHIDTLARQGHLFQQHGIVPAQSARAAAFVAEMHDVFEGARSAQGADLDREFMAGQVEFHLALLDLVDVHLLPAVEHKAMREELGKVRASTMLHLQKAHEIHCALTGQDPSQLPGQDPDGQGLIGPGAGLDLDRSDDLLWQGSQMGLDVDQSDDLLWQGAQMDLDVDQSDDLLWQGAQVNLDLDRSDDLLWQGAQVDLDVDQSDDLLWQGSQMGLDLSYELLGQAGRFDLDLGDDDDDE